MDYPPRIGKGIGPYFQMEVQIAFNKLDHLHKKPVVRIMRGAGQFKEINLLPPSWRRAIRESAE